MSTTFALPEVVASESGEPITLAEGKMHLRIPIADQSFDQEITDLISAARKEAERWTDKTLMLSRQHVWYLNSWPITPCRLPYLPLRTVDAIKYYDSDDVQQTIDSSNYIVRSGTDTPGYFEWVTGYSPPTLQSRTDAAQIEFSTGYISTDRVPPDARHAVKLFLEANYRGDDKQVLRETAKQLSHNCSWGRL